MKRVSGILVVMLILAVSASTLGSRGALAGGGDKEKKATKAFSKVLDKAASELAKFVASHPDSEEAAKARTILVMLYTKNAPMEWVRKHMKAAKVLLADLEEREDRQAGYLKGKLLEIEVVGNAPPAINTTGLDGKPILLDGYKGKVLLIDFWATWCGPCRAELPNVKAVFEKYKDQGFDILGVSLDRDQEMLEAFIAENEMPWRQIFDGKGWQNEIAVLYGVKSIPKTYLLDRDGKVVTIGVRGDALEPAVAALIEGKGTR